MNKNRSYNTKTGKMILEFFCANRDRAFGADEVFGYLKAQNTSVNLATVYRNINKLVKEKRIVKYNGDGGLKSVFQIAGTDNKCDEHIHIKCVKCGRVQHLECDFMDEIKHHLYEEHGFQLNCSGSVLYGVCKKCR